MFQKARKEKSKLRLAFVGPSGSGKTYSALAVAQGLGNRIALVDSERGSASKYADLFDFDVLDLESCHPQKYVEAIKAADSAGYDVVIIDSLSHAWMGKDGALELADRATQRSKSKNSYMAWAQVTPLQNQLVDAIIRSKCHVIATMRVKTDYVQHKTDSGKMAPEKVGLAPIQRDGMEYEFDLIGDLSNARLSITKSRCPALTDALIDKPGAALGSQLYDWLNDGVEPVEPVEPAERSGPWDQDILASMPGDDVAGEAPEPEAEPKPKHDPEAVAKNTQRLTNILNNRKESETGIEMAESQDELAVVLQGINKRQLTMADRKHVMALYRAKWEKLSPVAPMAEA